MKKKTSYGAIREFVRGYLHEDAMVEYGSASGAAKAWCEDASAAERKKLGAEWKKFAAEHKTVKSVNEAIAKMGGAWEFADVKEFKEMVKKF